MIQLRGFPEQPCVQYPSCRKRQVTDLENLRFSNNNIIFPIIVLLGEIIHRFVVELLGASRGQRCTAYAFQFKLLRFEVDELD